MIIRLVAFCCLTLPIPIVNSLDYPGVGPEHSFLKDIGRAEYYSITDEEALEGIDIILSFLSRVCQIFHAIIPYVDLVI